MSWIFLDPLCKHAEMEETTTNVIDGDDTPDVQQSSASAIQAIDKASVHRICSGQVVLNLSTAVKELVENSIDAGAKNIEIRLKEYGSELVEVVDNGCGVKEDNFEGLTLKHHTSKLRDFGDLVNVDTFGFRGEALSSLCALSKLTVTSCHKDTSIGTKLEYDHNGKLVKRIPCARQQGTTVSLQNLFSTLPVRHKEFHRNVKKEYAKMVQVLNAYCIISTGVRISCTNQIGKGKKSIVVSTNGNESMKENITNVFGAKQMTSLLEFSQARPEEEHCTDYGVNKQDTDGPFKISGYVSSCEHGSGRSSADRQFYFINTRPCDPTKISRLVNEVYHSYNRHQNPFVVLDISLDKESVDVNVTPDKRQIFIEHEKLLLATIKSSLIKIFEPRSSMFQVNQAQNKMGQSLLTMFTRDSTSPLKKHQSLPERSPSKSTPSSSLASLKRSFSSAFDSRSPSIDSPVVENKDKQRRLDMFVSRKHSPTKDSSISTPTNLTPLLSPSTDDTLPLTPIGKIPELTGSQSTDSGHVSDARESCADDRLHFNSPQIIPYRGISELSDNNNSQSDDRKDNLNTESPISGTIDHSMKLEVLDSHDTGSSKFMFIEHISSSNENTDHSKLSDNIDKITSPCDTNGLESVNPSLRSPDKVSGIEEVKVIRLAPPVEEIGASCSRGTDDVKVTYTEFDQPETSSARKETTVKFSLSALKTKRKADSSNEVKARSFRAKIAPSDNQSAEEELKREIRKDMFPRMEILGQFNLGFIITRLGCDLFLIDQHATDEKYNFERLQRETVLSSQKLIQPQKLELTAANETILIDNLDIFQKNGFEFVVDEDAPPGQRVKLVSKPVSKNWDFGKEDIEELVFMLSDTPGVMCRPSRIRSMFASRSCRTSVMIGTALNKAEMKKLVSHMAEIEQPWNCPHGRPTMRHLINLDMVPK